jgi:predicted TIM-barrel fold metal-dependent hydrolase
VTTWENLDRYLILSSDAHAGARNEQYKDYLDPDRHDEFDAWLAGVVNPWHNTSDTTNWDSADRLAAMDRYGIAGEVLFPNTLPPFFEVLAHLSGTPRDRAEFDRRWSGLRAHNRWLVEFCEELPHRRRGLIQLLPNDVEAAVAEMRWASRHRVIGGVMVPAVPPNHPVEPYWHERYDPLWRTAVECGYPVHQHQGSGSPDTMREHPVYRTVTYVDHELWTRLTLGHLIVGGVFDRHPELKVVWTEMPGLRWVVEDLERITRQLMVVQSRYAGDPTQLNFFRTFGSDIAERLELTPIEYFRRNCYIGASILSPFDIPFINVLGTDRIMWGHDAPHEEGASGLTNESLRINFCDFPVEDCRRMFTSTAAELYHFDLAELTPVAARIGPPISLVHTPLPPTERPEARGSAFWSPNAMQQALDDHLSIP